MTAVTGPVFIAIGGPSGAGKTVLTEALQHRLGYDNADIIPLDAYYRSHDNLDVSARAGLNFDSPDAFDWPLLIAHIKELKQGRTIARPVYDYATHSRSAATVNVDPKRFVLIEGILALQPTAVREHMDLCVYVESPEALCLERRIERDTQERGRTRESVMQQYNDTVKPMLDQHVQPSRSQADLIVHGDQDITHSVDTIIQTLAG